MDRRNVTHQLSLKTTDELKTIRAFAAEQNNNELVSYCDKEIARREPVKIVRGFHFHCESGRGVKKNADGTISTRSWVVSKDNADMAVKIGAYVALHNSHSEMSYAQGTVAAWKPAPRDPLPGEQIETREGVEFTLQPTPTSLPWRGNGTVEKSYWYGDDDFQ